VALWSDCYAQTKPTPVAVEVALEALRRGAA